MRPVCLINSSNCRDRSVSSQLCCEKIFSIRRTRWGQRKQHRHGTGSWRPLFYEYGFRAVGIDTIIEKSGVAKMSLYRNFATKDDLIVEYLRASNEGFWSMAQPALDDTTMEPLDRLAAFFDLMQTIATRDQCWGCTFTMASSDFPDRDHPAHQMALVHKRKALDLFADHARRGGLAEPTDVAEQLLLLLDGAWTSARMFGPTGPARQLAAGARSVIAGAERVAGK
jgi:AcrR family transcriptional regulator